MKELCVWVSEVVWGGLWSGTGVSRASESKVDPRQQSGVSQVVVVWGCRQLPFTGLNEESCLRRGSEDTPFPCVSKYKANNHTQEWRFLTIQWLERILRMTGVGAQGRKEGSCTSFLLGFKYKGKYLENQGDSPKILQLGNVRYMLMGVRIIAQSSEVLQLCSFGL